MADHSYEMPSEQHSQLVCSKPCPVHFWRSGARFFKQPLDDLPAECRIIVTPSWQQMQDLSHFLCKGDVLVTLLWFRGHVTRQNIIVASFVVWAAFKIKLNGIVRPFWCLFQIKCPQIHCYVVVRGKNEEVNMGLRWAQQIEQLHGSQERD